MNRPLTIFLCVFLCWFSAGLTAQSARVQVDVGDRWDAREQLEQLGFVVEKLHAPTAENDFYWLEIIVTAEELPLLQGVGYPVTVLEWSRPLRDMLDNGQDNFESGYYTWNELNQEMLNWQNSYPGLAQRVNITNLTGTAPTHEGRDIYALKISDNAAQDEDEPQMLLVSNHHAREISTPVSAVEWMAHLLTNYGIHSAITGYVDQNEIWIIPTLNPDGLEYAWNTDQWWRKNRRNNGGGIYGVDLNRNYPFRWAYCGSFSHDPSSNTYAGPFAASEPEVQTLIELARDRRFAKVIDFHTYGREVLYPYVCMSMPAQIQNKVTEVRDQLATAASYAFRLPSSSGEHFEWEFNEIGAISYLLELDTTFFPTYSQALIETARVVPALDSMAAEPIPFSGHVYDAFDGTPVEADIAVAGVNYSENEERRSGGVFGRFHYWIQNGTYSWTFSANGYQAKSFSQTVSSAGTEVDVFLNPSNRPFLNLEGQAQAGSQVRFRLENGAAYNGQNFVVWLSRTGGGPFVTGIPVSGGLTVPVTSDALTNWGQVNTGVLTGPINAFGTGATAWSVIPNQAAGWHIWAAAVIYSGSSNNDVTPAYDFRIP